MTLMEGFQLMASLSRITREKSPEEGTVLGFFTYVFIIIENTQFLEPLTCNGFLALKNVLIKLFIK